MVHARLAEDRYVQLAAGTVQVVPGETTVVEFRPAIANAQIKLLDPNGAPVPNASIQLNLVGRSDRRMFVRTGEEGVAELFGSPGAYTAVVRVRSMLDDERYDRWRMEQYQTGASPQATASVLRSVLVEVGPVDIAAGVTPEPLVIRLPPSWDR